MHSLDEAHQIAKNIIERDVRVNKNDDLLLSDEELEKLHP